MNRLTSFLLLSALTCVAPAAFAAETAAPSEEPRVSVTHYGCEMTELTVDRTFTKAPTISARVRSASSGCFRHLRGRFWSAGSAPKTVITSLEISVDGKAIDVPVSAFAGLGDVAVVHIDRDGTDYAITLRPQGAETYTARVILHDGKIARRSVSRMPGAEAAEETTYR